MKHRNYSVKDNYENLKLRIEVICELNELKEETIYDHEVLWAERMDGSTSVRVQIYSVSLFAEKVEDVDFPLIFEWGLWHINKLMPF